MFRFLILDLIRPIFPKIPEILISRNVKAFVKEKIPRLEKMYN